MSEIDEARKALVWALCDQTPNAPEQVSAIEKLVRAVVAESRPQPSAPERPAEKCPTCGVLRGSPASQKQCADAWHRSAEVARPSSGGVPDPLPAVLPEGTRVVQGNRDVSGWRRQVVYRAPGGGEYCLESQIARETISSCSNCTGGKIVTNVGIIDCARCRPTPAPAEAASEWSGGQQAGRDGSEPSDELHFCDYTTGPFICEGDACNGHTVKEMRAYDAGRASLERCIAWFEENNWRLDGAEKDRLLQLKRELGRGA